MKIAVISVDGVTVAPTLADARAVLVFETSGNHIESRERRSLSGLFSSPVSTMATVPSGIRHPDSWDADSASTRSCLLDESVDEVLLSELLDCQMLIAGAITPAESARLRQLGILALPLFAGERAEAAVRFAINGEPPKEGEACGVCPNRGERHSQRNAGDRLPPRSLISLVVRQPAPAGNDPSAEP